MQRVLITGTTGMLGAKVAETFYKTGAYDVYTTGRRKADTSYRYLRADLINKAELENLLTTVEPDIIIHCAANTDLNNCELNKDTAYQLHVEATKQLASFNAGKCLLVYISTDSVYKDGKGNYSVTDTTAPLNYYALSKLLGEQAAAQANQHHLIIRTNIYGYHQHAGSTSLFEWMYKSLKAQKTITGFSDVCFNPLYTGQLANVLINLIKVNATGIYNAGCNEFISKYEFVVQAARLFSLNDSLIEEGCSGKLTAQLPRPKNTTLNTAALNNILQKNYSFKHGLQLLQNDFLLNKNQYE